MSDSPSPDTPTPPWGLRLGSSHPDNTETVDRMRSRLLTTALVAVVAVLVFAAAGVVLVVLIPSWSAIVSVSVVVACVVVVLVAALRAGSALRHSVPRQWPTAPVASSETPAAPVPSQPRSSAPVTVPRPSTAGTVAHPAGPVSSTDMEPPVALSARTDVPATDESLHGLLGDDPGRRREVFVKLARRLQSLVNRAIRKIDGLEREIEDPEILKGLYDIDHLVTRVRRQAENLAVLGGEAPQRRSSKPVSIYAVLRSAVAEVEHYKQVTIVPTENVNLHGHVVTEVIHLLAELLENATNFTPPDSPKVVVRAQRVTAGLAIEIQDRGLGMTTEDLHRINHLLDGSTHIDLSELLRDGRIGLAVVKELSRRHDVRVQLQPNIFGGIDAAVVVPHTLLSDPSPEPRSRRREDDQQSVPEQSAVETTSVSGQLLTDAEDPEPVVSASTGGRHRSLAADNVDGSPGWEQQSTNGPLPSLPTREPGAVFFSPAPVDREDLTESMGSPVPPPLPPAPSPQLRSSQPRESQPRESQPREPQSPATEQPVTQQSRPPLPHRRGQSHLRPELLEPPAPTTPLVGHNANLMASIRQGLDRGLADASEPHQSQQAQSTEDSRHGG